MESVDKVLCYSCNKSKNQLASKKSNLLPINLLICEGCNTSKFEPRWIVVLSGRQFGAEYVKDYISKKRYVGVEITASELLI